MGSRSRSGAAIEALAPLVEGLDLDWIADDGARFWRHVTGDSQLRWIGPEKGAIHLAAAGMASPDEAAASIAAMATPLPPALWTDLKRARLLRPDAPVPGAAD